MCRGPLGHWTNKSGAQERCEPEVLLWGKGGSQISEQPKSKWQGSHTFLIAVWALEPFICSPYFSSVFLCIFTLFATVSYLKTPHLPVEAQEETMFLPCSLVLLFSQGWGLLSCRRFSHTSFQPKYPSSLTANNQVLSGYPPGLDMATLIQVFVWAS